MKTHFYYLIDPDTKEIRYIGQSKHPKNRLKAHINNAKSGKDKNTRKNNWINKLLAANKLPEMLIFEEFCGDPIAAHKREWFHIQKHFNDGHNLTNGNDGGVPYILPDDKVKKVYQYDRTTLMFIKEYRNAFDASIETGIHDSGISGSAKSIDKHKVRFAGNFLWSFDYYTLFPKERLLFSIRHNRKKVKATNLITKDECIFVSAREASRQLKLSYRNISQVCKGEKKTHKGFTFCFV